MEGMITLLSYVVMFVSYVAHWKIFVKMGMEGWKALIPFYNTYLMFKALYGNGWKFLLLLIPVYHIYVFIKFYIDVSKAFEKPEVFAAGLIFMGVVFLCILAFDESEYHPPEKITPEKVQ